MKKYVWMVVGLTMGWAGASAANEVALVTDVEFQPLAAQVQRVAKALEFLGDPLSEKQIASLNQLYKSTKPADAIKKMQQILDTRVLAVVEINAESRVKSFKGSANPILVQQGWTNYLIKVANEAGVTAQLNVASPNAAPMYKKQGPSQDPKIVIEPGDVQHRFLDLDFFNDRPLNKSLSGLEVEYRILQIYCRDAGKREASLSFNVGQGTQELGFKDAVAILFESRPATQVKLNIQDHDGSPTMASLLFRDVRGRVYPAQTRRLAPDLFFHPQVYRKDGETLALPAGDYTVEFGRGPEYHIQTKKIRIPNEKKHTLEFKLTRWIEPKKQGWYSGDHHVHAAGCRHYDNPTKGIKPEDMYRHQLGEDLNVACVLSWGPCWYFQKQFFEGKVNHLSNKNYLMRYDVEVSGFPSSHAGHLCLLNLIEDDYPDTKKIEDWPSFDLPILKWGKRQGGVVGFSHSGWGLKTKSDKLPNYEIPPFDGIGANEYIVDVAHGVCDFISTVDTPAVWELNIWYHTLNCGMTCKISGETDFPCIYGERIGLGRVYVKCDGELTYKKWVQGLKQGRSYVSDGLSHLMNFQVNDLPVGESASLLKLSKPGPVTLKADVAALLEKDAKKFQSLRQRKLDQQPYWHVERARIGDSRTVPVELIVNGKPVAKKEILADGATRAITFSTTLEKSSWVALRIFPSSHTNPIFVEVAGKPIRTSKKSAQWCMDSVDQCWKQKSKKIRESEKQAAKAAFDKAKATYAKIRDESTDD